MELYHASKEIVQYPEIRKTKYTNNVINLKAEDIYS